MDIWRNDRRAPAGRNIAAGEKIEAWGQRGFGVWRGALQEELMESGNAGNPDLNHNTCLAKKNLKTVQASSVIKVYVDGWIVTRWKNLSETRGFIL